MIMMISWHICFTIFTKQARPMDLELICLMMFVLFTDCDFSRVKVVDLGNALHCVHEELSLYYDDFELQTLLYRAPEVILINHANC